MRNVPWYADFHTQAGGAADMSISAQEYLRRYQGLRDLMEQENLDCILVAGRGG